MGPGRDKSQASGIRWRDEGRKISVLWRTVTSKHNILSKFHMNRMLHAGSRRWGDPWLPGSFPSFPWPCSLPCDDEGGEGERRFDLENLLLAIPMAKLGVRKNEWVPRRDYSGFRSELPRGGDHVMGPKVVGFTGSSSSVGFQITSHKCDHIHVGGIHVVVVMRLAKVVISRRRRIYSTKHI